MRVQIRPARLGSLASFVTAFSKICTGISANMRTFREMVYVLISFMYFKIFHCVLLIFDEFTQTGDHSSTINRNIVKGPDYGVNVVKQQLTVPSQPGGVTMAVPVRAAANMQSQMSGKGPELILVVPTHKRKLEAHSLNG